MFNRKKINTFSFQAKLSQISFMSEKLSISKNLYAFLKLENATIQNDVENILWSNRAAGAQHISGAKPEAKPNQNSQSQRVATIVYRFRAYFNKTVRSVCCCCFVPRKFLAARLPTGTVNGSHSENLFIGLSCKIYAALKAATRPSIAGAKGLSTRWATAESSKQNTTLKKKLREKTFIYILKVDASISPKSISVPHIFGALPTYRTFKV